MGSSRDSDLFKPGDVINSTYEIEAVLGRGGTGEVYRARNVVGRRIVAIKTLRASFAGQEEYHSLIRREEAIRDVYHDAVVKYSEAGMTADGNLFLVMDYVEGPSLYARMKQGGVPVADLLLVARRVAEGLAACHAKDIVHRDLSPDNIILRGGDPERAVIIDFGIAKDTRVGAETIVGHGFAGKYEYAPPEQLGGRTDARSDLYALGMSLLASFRGKTPSVGNSPGEIVENKKLPPDVEGVPEPLRTLIAELTEPEAGLRPQSAEAVVELLDRLGAPRPMTVTRAAPPMADAPTVLSAPPSAASRVRPATTPPRASRQPAGGSRVPAPDAPPARRSRAPLAAAAAVVLLALGGGGAWVSGLLDPWLGEALPVASPYIFTAELAPGGGLTARGYAPSVEAAGVISAGLTGRFGARAEDIALSAAEGAPTPDWSGDIDGMLAAIEPLEDWTLEVRDSGVTLAGLAPDSATRDAVAAALAAAAGGRGYGIESEIGVGPRTLMPARIDEVLAGSATCGALRLNEPPAAGYGLGERVAVIGRVATAADLETLRTRLGEVAGDRPVALGVNVYNPPVCQLLSILPDSATSDMDIWLGYGDSDQANETGAYSVGENPVIDILIPEDQSDGYLHVMAVDVSGSVFHLLPNAYRTDNRIADLGRVGSGKRRVRVAYPAADREGDSSVIAFVIDDTFGKTLIAAFRTREPLFDEVRPIAESAESLAERMRERKALGLIDSADLALRFIDTRS